MKAFSIPGPAQRAISDTPEVMRFCYRCSPTYLFSQAELRRLGIRCRPDLVLRAVRRTGREFP
jgi:hypothetical protein